MLIARRTVCTNSASAVYKLGTLFTRVIACLVTCILSLLFTHDRTQNGIFLLGFASLLMDCPLLQQTLCVVISESACKINRTNIFR